jgi:glycosyltransferase involved in cell wall biosynthesis
MNQPITRSRPLEEAPLLDKPNLPEPTVAFLHAYDLAEDFLDSIGVSLETYCNEMTGGWLFGYVEALKTAGVRSVLFCISARVDKVQRVTHAPTGATLCFLPAPRLYRIYRQIRTIRRRTLNLEEEFSGSNVSGSNGAEANQRSHLAWLKTLASAFGTYLLTPLGLLRQELRRENCQALLCQEYEYGRFDICVLFSKVLHISVMATFQGKTFAQRSLLEAWIRPWTVRACQKLIISSQTEIQRVQADYAVPSSKIARIFSPVDISAWGVPDRERIRTALDIPLAAKVVICHGRIEIHKKGLDVLLSAWELICQARPDQNLRLLLVGTGSDAEEFQRQVAAMPFSNIIWKNEYIQDRTLLRQYLAAADMYTLPSRWEGFPVAPIEAMACGLPIVAAEAQGVIDILENGEASGGLVVPRDNPQALATAIGRILDNPTLAKKLGNDAAHRARAAFSLEAIGQQLRNSLLQ